MIKGNRGKVTSKDAAWIAKHKRKNQEVRSTKNGHPYAVLRASVMKKRNPFNKR